VCWRFAAAMHVTQQQCYCLGMLKMCTYGWDVRFACCAGCGQLLWSPLPQVTTTPAHSASSSRVPEANPAVTGANPEPAAVQATCQHPTSTVPLSGETSAELPPGAAREETPCITADSARNASSTRAGTTVGKALLCSACMCVKEVAGYSGMYHLHSCPSSMICPIVMTGHMIPPSLNLLMPPSPNLLAPDSPDLLKSDIS